MKAEHSDPTREAYIAGQAHALTAACLAFASVPEDEPMTAGRVAVALRAVLDHVTNPKAPVENN